MYMYKGSRGRAAIVVFVSQQGKARAATMAELEVDAADLVRIIQQFLKENSLHATLHALQEESQVALNTVENVEAFVADVQHGRWDAVMAVVATLKLPQKLLWDLYEQIVLELLELRELETARHVLRSAEPMIARRERHSERHERLELSRPGQGR